MTVDWTVSHDDIGAAAETKNIRVDCWHDRRGDAHTSFFFYV
jgi:hypothetical protein